MYTYCKKYGNKVFLRDHEKDYKCITKHSWNLYYENKNGDFKSIFGKSLKKETYKTISKAMTVKKENEKYINIYGAKDFGYQYIRDVYSTQEPININSLYIGNIDIETGRDEKGYSSPEEVRCPITAITLHNLIQDKFFTWGYKEEGYISKSDNSVFIDCIDEKDLLMKFVSFISFNYPDVITGFNCEQYDIPYIINRIFRIFKDGGLIINNLSPFGIVNEREKRDEFGNIRQIYDIVGVPILDYLTLFKKFTYKTPENYKLNTIAHLILGDEKIDYSEYANLQELYNEDYEKFIDYKYS